MNKRYDVLAICNALMDILILTDDSHLANLELRKGIMHLVDDQRQTFVLQQFNGKDRTTELGGSSMNAIRSLAALGAKTVFAGMIGNDEVGDQIQSRLHDLGVVGKLVATAGATTGTCLVLITPDGERTMNTNLGASCLFDEALVPEDEIKESRVFHFCGYQWASDGQKRAIRSAMAIARQHETLISFDAADPWACEGNQADFINLIREEADIVFANREEARILFGSPEKAVDEITRSGAIAVVKLGADGAMIGRGRERIAVAAVKTSVVDTTGAGDMFAAGFLFGHTRNLPLATCGVMAATLAADVIARVGARVTEAAFTKVRDLASAP